MFGKRYKNRCGVMLQQEDTEIDTVMKRMLKILQSAWEQRVRVWFKVIQYDHPRWFRISLVVKHVASGAVFIETLRPNRTSDHSLTST